ncbi:hypothetical protein BD779DRAFT_1474516 [Infundibulicybe gibba]|nr:hypothetical protein BD779DRAFT_1474516 [Infundibulicybe gibba]
MAAALTPLVAEIQNLRTRVDQLEAGVGGALGHLEATIVRADRRSTILMNETQGSGDAAVYEIVLFPDHSSPEDASIAALTPEQVDAYYELYYPQGQASTANSRLIKVYVAVGARIPSHLHY